MAERQPEIAVTTRESSRAAERPIKIVHVIFRLDVGGLENGLVNLINGLPTAQFEHTVICLDTFTEFRNRIVGADVQVIALNKSPGVDPMMYARLWKHLRKINPDVVHTRNLGTLPCVFVAVLAGVSVRIHGEHGWDMVDLRGSQLKYRILRRFIDPFVTVYVAVSQHISKWLVNSVGLGKAKVVHIINGVDAKRFMPRVEPDHDKKSLGGEASHSHLEGKLVIGTVGRLEEVKNQKALIEAVALLMEQRPDLAAKIEVIIVGDGSLENVLKRTVIEAGISKIVRLVGSQEDIPAFLQRMDVFVLPSLNEGISNTILEAMACGIPVVATAVGGNPEIVDDGQTGALVAVSDRKALAEAIARYCDRPDLRLTHGAAARKRVLDTMSLAKMIANYSKLYRNAAGK